MNGFSLLPGLLIFALFALVVIRIVQALVRAGGIAQPQQAPDEVKLINDLAHGLERMEQRIEAIETIVAATPESRQAHDRLTG
jgi:phage shock protein B